jgi:cell division transport system permease protein
MRAWLRHHRIAFADALKRISLLNALVIGVALALPAGGYALLDSLRPASARLALEPRISLFLEPQLKRADAEALGKRLRADRRIGTVRFVTREEALKEMSSVQGMAEVIAALGRNPLPDATS